VGIPADTLRQRPDVRSAERRLASATARIGVAEAQLYPSLQISGNIGTSALEVGNLFSVITGGLFAGISQAIFEGGRLRSQVRGQQAAAEGAFATYKQTVLTALEDVQNGLSALQSARQRHIQFAEALDAARNQAILARSEYRSGLTDFQTLLQAERALNSASDGLLTSQADESRAVVQLYRALGGGWEPLTPVQETVIR
jgi:outer membrane protein TolC